ncbi:MAG: hypothetical protein A2Y73_07385 [Chloroflexi bacterium RBG_13_56_8]|nr:MAG: hypothetical protein A2Y73_07385 [Chloroflexi bacterium RBG_13_56_8]
MYLGIRKVRSAGQNSGSVEVTLPAKLRILERVECRVVVRDGSSAEIVLQPDLAMAHSMFRELWERLRVGLREIGDIGDFSADEFALTLFPTQYWHHHPPLAYADALVVLKHRRGPQHWDSGALARLLTFLSVVAVRRLGLSESLALAFGDAVAYLTTGTSVGLGTDFERGMAHDLLWGEGHSQPFGSPLDDHIWRQVGPGLRRVYEQFQAWQNDPEAYRIARQKWYRALTVEMGIR